MPIIDEIKNLPSPQKDKKPFHSREKNKFIFSLAFLLYISTTEGCSKPVLAYFL